VNRNLAGATSIASIVAQAADEYLEQLTRGETPDLSEYAARYPQIASVLPQVLPVLRMIQGMASGDLTAGASFTAPCALGEFQLQREIGRGGMGVVYEAIQVPLGRKVALKILPMGPGADARQLARFQIEAQVAAALHHPHIVPIFAVGCDQGVHYYAMQLIEGRCLAAMVAEQRKPGEPGSPGPAGTKALSPDRLSPLAAADLAIQAAEALEHAHALGVLHRDIKPANLLLGADGHLWVTDFGLARLQGTGDLTHSGDLLGTVRYMSPEQASGGRILDARTDVYSLGATLYELLTGQRAFDGGDQQELVRQITCDDPIPPRKLDPTIPRDLETIVGKAMAKEPERRYSTAQDFADDLRRFREDRPILAKRPTVAGRITRWSRRHRRATAAGTAFLFVFALASAAGMARLWQERRHTLDALQTAEFAQNRERQALFFTFAASDQITARALELVESARNSREADRDQEFCRKALDYYQEIAARYDRDPSMQTIVAATYHRIGFIRMILHQEHAKEALERAIALYTAMRESGDSSEEIRSALALTYGDLLLLERGGGSAAAALETLEKLVAVRRALAGDFPQNMDYAISLAYHEVDLCEALRAAGRVEEADQAQTRMPVNTHVAWQENCRDARLCNNIAWLMVSRPGSPADHAALAVELARKGVSLEPSHASYWNTLGLAQYRAGDWKGAATALGESMRLEDGGNAHDWIFMSMIRARLNQPAEARTWYARANAWIESKAPRDQELLRFRDEAAALPGLAELATGKNNRGIIAKIPR